MFQPIQTARLTLRCLSNEDADALFAYRSDPDVARFQSWVPESLGEVQQFIARMREQEFGAVGWYQIAIALQNTPGIIGDLGIHILESEPRIAEIGITLAPSFQSKGFATEALKAVLSFLFIDMHKHRVIASVDPRNTASMKLMERAGFRQEGLHRKSFWLKNEWVDDAVFALLESDWNEKSD
jgi:RimJ/RimL family protein N-acetyltransferase